MLNYFNFRKIEGRYLITNDAGQYSFIDADALKQLISGEVQLSTDQDRILRNKGFIYESRESFLEDQRKKLRRSKGYLLHCTSLHIFILTRNI